MIDSTEYRNAATDRRLRCIEWFCGIGGFAAGCQDTFKPVAAVDIHRAALEIYQANFSFPRFNRTIESLELPEAASWQAEAWWLSPPCQPFTRRGHQRDLSDPRCAALVRLIEWLPELQPIWVGLENVPPFADSQAYRRLVDTAIQSGYMIDRATMCPSELGIPNRRRRFYLVLRKISRADLPRERQESEQLRPGNSVTPLNNLFRNSLSQFLDSRVDDRLWLDPSVIAAYSRAVDVVEPGDRELTACFTSAYGRSLVRSGSYLKCGNRHRRFSPREVARLLGFPESFHLPSWSSQKLWPLLGNSLSLYCVRELVRRFPPVSRSAVQPHAVL